MSKESLADFVSRVMNEKNLSGYYVERKSGKGISQSYANRIKNGEIRTPSAEKLNALAKGLEVPASELFAIVRGAPAQHSDLTHERLQTIEQIYGVLSGEKRESADYLIGLLEREFRRLENAAELS